MKNRILAIATSMMLSIVIAAASITEQNARGYRRACSVCAGHIGFCVTENKF